MGLPSTNTSSPTNPPQRSILMTTYELSLVENHRYLDAIEDKIMLFDICSKVQFYYYLRAHYNVILKSIEVGDAVLQHPSDGFDTHSGKPMIMDSGTTLAYLGDELFNPLMKKILVAQPNLKLLRVQVSSRVLSSLAQLQDKDCSFDRPNANPLDLFPGS
ncbi:hypothetical protein LOK49_LG13G01438 [Camellia lanceoleosa]|uniref:Uncharacterized protein n=1 Tax=Camellia lanceoleosa TaxID=1840588 RepID=A0ACC0FMG1_9ERIC|nr:hypothetical protein LOK49_LG13G01438 [Camellia lanceoleosa]